jgi:hypothetical protein
MPPREPRWAGAIKTVLVCVGIGALLGAARIGFLLFIGTGGGQAEPTGNEGWGPILGTIGIVLGLIVGGALGAVVGIVVALVQRRSDTE